MKIVLIVILILLSSNSFAQSKGQVVVDSILINYLKFTKSSKCIVANISVIQEFVNNDCLSVGQVREYQSFIYKNEKHSKTSELLLEVSLVSIENESDVRERFLSVKNFRLGSDSIIVDINQLQKAAFAASIYSKPPIIIMYSRPHIFIVKSFGVEDKEILSKIERELLSRGFESW